MKVLVRSFTLIFSFSNSFSLSSLIEAFLELLVDEVIDEDDMGEASFVFLCGNGGGAGEPGSRACLELERDKSLLDMTELDRDMLRTGTGGA